MILKDYSLSNTGRKQKNSRKKKGCMQRHHHRNSLGGEGCFLSIYVWIFIFSTQKTPLLSVFVFYQPPLLTSFLCFLNINALNLLKVFFIRLFKIDALFTSFRYLYHNLNTYFTFITCSEAQHNTHQNTYLHTLLFSPLFVFSLSPS